MIKTYGLTEDFIKNIVDFIDAEYLKKGRDISRLAFIFGGRRPSLFLKKRLSAMIGKPFSPPVFFSMDEFVEYIALKKGPFTRISDMDASFIIYGLAKRIAPGMLKGREAFSNFLPWAREILYFIEQLDLEDIKPSALENIQDKAAIGYDVPENINSLLNSIVSIRDGYHAELKKRNACSRGLMYLLASGQIGNDELAEFDALHFCGFFYLHKTEQALLKDLHERKKAWLFFQGGAEEWSVLQKASKELSCDIVPDDCPAPDYELKIQSGFDVHSEAGLARQALKSSKDLGKTVIVLPEPGNVIPLLSEIAGCADEFNVSMGYPLKRSSLYWLLECVFKAQETRKDGLYYSRDYMAVLSHPLVKNLKFFNNPSITRVLVHKIEEVLAGIEKTSLAGSRFLNLSDIENSGELYSLAGSTMGKMDIDVASDELKGTVKRLHELLFLSWEPVRDLYGFSGSLSSFMRALVEKSPLKEYPLNLKMAQRIFSLSEELESAAFNKEPFLREEIFKIFQTRLNSEMISFSGSPLKGLQILGLLETRSLNFENVIIMDANESVLPSLKIYEPLIPREVMISLGINRIEKEEEIQRYQFRRLISSAKKVHLIYQQRDDKEKSRFLEELIWEKEQQKGSIGAVSIARANFSVKVLPKKLSIRKDAKVISYLLGREYSASSVNTYLHCPLSFYYQYVLGLREKEDLLSQLEGKDIGTFIHELFNAAFARFIGRGPVIDAKFRKNFFALLEKKFDADFRHKMSSDAFLLKEILDFRMKQFLDNEKERPVESVICLEKVFKGRIETASKVFRLTAIIDRVDSLNDGTALILDYKTGGSDIMPETDPVKVMSASKSRVALKTVVRSFQLPLYLYLALKDPCLKGKDTNACLYFIKDINKDKGMSYLFGDNCGRDQRDKLMDSYLNALRFILGEIVDPDVPFAADEEDARKCGYCPFFYMCR